MTPLEVVRHRDLRSILPPGAGSPYPTADTRRTARGGYTLGVIFDWENALVVRCSLPIVGGDYRLHVRSSVHARQTRYGLYARRWRGQGSATQAVHVGDNYTPTCCCALGGHRGILLTRGQAAWMALDCRE